jgi:hypothetical protein
LKAPGANRLKLNFDYPLSIIAFKFNLRRHSWDTSAAAADVEWGHAEVGNLRRAMEWTKAGAYTRPLSGSS